MTTPPEAESSPQRVNLFQRLRNRWIVVLGGAIVVVAGVALLWPNGEPELPDNFCSYIGTENLTKLVPSPRLRYSKIEGVDSTCVAESASGDQRLRVELSRGEDSADGAKALCQSMASREDMRQEEMVKPAESTFSDRMCGWISASPQLGATGDIYVVQANDRLSISYDVKPGDRKLVIERDSVLADAIFTKLGS
ncbi:hypothetical protein [Flindersiella endophytica]